MTLHSSPFELYSVKLSMAQIGHPPLPIDFFDLTCIFKILKGFFKLLIFFFFNSFCVGIRIGVFVFSTPAVFRFLIFDFYGSPFCPDPSPAAGGDTSSTSPSQQMAGTSPSAASSTSVSNSHYLDLPQVKVNHEPQRIAHGC